MEPYLKDIGEFIIANIIGTTKEVLTSDECAKYMGISKSQLYKMTSRNELPHYKPSGKYIYFNRKEIEKWLQQNRVATKDEISGQAELYCMNTKKS